MVNEKFSDHNMKDMNFFNLRRNWVGDGILSDNHLSKLRELSNHDLWHRKPTDHLLQNLPSMYTCFH